MRCIRTVLLAAVFASMLSVAEAQQQIYVPNWFDGDVSVVNSATLETIVRIPIDGDPSTPEIDFAAAEAVAFSRDLKFAFVSIDDGDKIAVIDTAMREVVKYIQGLPGSLETLIYARPKGDRMYVTNCAFGTVTVIDVRKQEAIDVNPATPELDGILLPDGGSYEMAFSPDGRLGYVGSFGPACAGVAELERGIYRLDLSMNTYLGFIDTTKRVTGLAVSPDRHANVALATGEDRILVIDVDPLAPVEVGPVMCGFDGLAGFDEPCSFGGTNAVAFNADGTRAYVVDWSLSKLITLDMTVPLMPQVLSRVPIDAVASLGPWEIAISGNRAYLIVPDFVDFLESELVSFDISTDTPVQLLNDLVGFGALQLGVGPALPPVNAHGAGQIPGKVHFEFKAKSIKNGPDFKGGCLVIDKSVKPHRTIRCLDVTSLVVDGDTATIEGRATDSAFPGMWAYEIEVTDNGTPGKNNDEFKIKVFSPVPFEKEGTLKGGNVTIKD